MDDYYFISYKAKNLDDSPCHGHCLVRTSQCLADIIAHIEKTSEVKDVSILCMQPLSEQQYQRLAGNIHNQKNKILNE